MNKIIQINLAGQAISIDEIAYKSLEKYLHSLESYFRNTESGDEIISDIEARLLELFLTKLKGSHTFIDQKDVDEAIELMGSLSDMGLDDDLGDDSQNAGSSSTYTNRSKKLFRDPDDKILGGVCAGLAAYLGMDTSVVRLIFIILLTFAGAPLIIYIILWIVIPEAQTAQDRFRMHGETPDINDIVDSVRNEANRVAKNIKKKSNLNYRARGVSNGASQVFRLIFKVIGAFILAVLLLAAFTTTVALLGIATGHSSMMINGEHWATPLLFDSTVLSWVFAISLLTVVITPIATIIYSLVRFILDLPYRLNVRYVFLAWLIALMLFIGISFFAAPHANWDEWRELKPPFHQNDFV